MDPHFFYLCCVLLGRAFLVLLRLVYLVFRKLLYILVIITKDFTYPEFFLPLDISVCLLIFNKCPLAPTCATNELFSILSIHLKHSFPTLSVPTPLPTAFDLY